MDDRCARCGRKEYIPTSQFVKYDLKINYLCRDCWTGFNHWFNAKDRIRFIHNEQDEEAPTEGEVTTQNPKFDVEYLRYVPESETALFPLGGARVCKNFCIWAGEPKEGGDE